VPKRRAGNEADDAPEALGFRGSQFSRAPLWGQACAPQNLIRHPVPQPGKAALQEQGRFERKLAMALEKGSHHSERKLAREERGRQARPPLRRLGPEGETHSAELAGIGKDQRALGLVKGKMIVFSRSESSLFDAQFSC
jgi:hypothetical protein